MEAMFVSTVPPSHGKPSTTNNSSKGSETGFAPALNEAINEKKNSTSQQSESEKSQHSAKSNIPEKENNTSPLEENQDSPEDVAAYGAAEKKSSSSLQQQGSANFSSINRNAANTEITGADAKQGISKNIGDDNLAKFLNGEQVKSNNVSQESSLLKNTDQSTATVSNHRFSTSPYEGKSASDLRGTVSSTEQQSDNRLSDRLSGKSGSSVQLLANDSITISHSKPQTTQLSGQKFTPTSILEAAGVHGNERYRQAGNNGNGLSEYATQNPGQLNSNHNNLPLSAEKIAARITDIPFQQNIGNTSLREGNQSLRHDWLGEFIEAKVDQFQGKSSSKTGQELLNSEGEMSANNSSGAPAKGGEKGGETTFSQTLHLAAADKQVASGVEMQRPAATNIMLSQFQENDILHQVIHKIRLSQHTQDSKLVMKLHPAELGSLKIDIHLKDGTINANILAQSQQVQEILEKNMPRLRALMEEQGLKVNEIAINLESEPTEQNNLFDEHLAQDNKGFANNSKNNSGEEFVLEVDDTEVTEVAPTPLQSGVNVLI